jgi:phage protein D
VRGQVEDDGSEKKQTIRVRATKKVRQRYGFVHDYWNLEGEKAKSEAELRKLAKRELADRQEPEEEVTITVPGYPGLQRGDAIRLNWPQADMKELVYVTAASHSVSAGDYTTDLTLSFDEYYEDKEGEKIREKLCKKAEEKGRKKPAWCRENYDPFAPAKKRPKKNQNKRNNTKPKAKAK